MKFSQTVLFLLCLLGCSRPANDHPAGSAPSTGRPLAPPAPDTAPTASAQTAPSPAAPVASGSAAGDDSATPTAEAAPSGSAYAGCGKPLALSQLWDETTEGEVLDAIGAAKTCAAEHGRRLLLEFVAPWCEDCREMAKLDASESVAATLQARFERVRINVGKWDRHEALRNNYDVHALATYIVIEPRSGKVLAKTTLEPITKPGQKLSAADWARWLQAH